MKCFDAVFLRRIIFFYCQSTEIADCLRSQTNTHGYFDVNNVNKTMIHVGYRKKLLISTNQNKYRLTTLLIIFFLKKISFSNHLKFHSDPEPKDSEETFIEIKCN